jgi:hypothetical protein
MKIILGSDSYGKKNQWELKTENWREKSKVNLCYWKGEKEQIEFRTLLFCGSTEFRASFVLGKCSTIRGMLPFCFSYFSDRVSCFLTRDGFRPSSSHQHLHCSWDDRHAPSFQVYSLKLCLTKFLLRLSLKHDLLNLHLPSSWDYRHEPLPPASR